jgi:hypothetical protein
MSKWLLKNKKNIILMHFQVKNILKNNHNYTLKQAEKQIRSAKKKWLLFIK